MAAPNAQACNLASTFALNRFLSIEHLTFRRGDLTGEQIDQGAFTGAVGAQNGMYFVGFHIKVHVIDGNEATKTTRQALGG